MREELDGSLSFAFGSLCAHLAAFHFEMKSKDERRAISSRIPQRGNKRVECAESDGDGKTHPLIFSAYRENRPLHNFHENMML